MTICASLLAVSACGKNRAEEAVAALLPDPQAARFQAVTQNGDAVCGEVNGGSEGGTRGYRRFIYAGGIATIAPLASYQAADLAAFDATCRMLGSQGNGLDRQVCTRAADARRANDEAAAFEALWNRTCNQ